MSSQTESEKKIAEILRNTFTEKITEDLKEDLENVRIQTIDRDSDKKILLIKMSEGLLAVIRSDFTTFNGMVKSTYPDFHALVIRDTKIISVPIGKRFHYEIESKNMKAHVHESWIKDLCYPALVEMRKTDIFNGVEKIESALVSDNCSFTDEDFFAMEFAFKSLTNRIIHYGRIFY